MAAVGVGSAVFKADLATPANSARVSRCLERLSVGITNDRSGGSAASIRDVSRA